MKIIGMVLILLALFMAVSAVIIPLSALHWPTIVILGLGIGIEILNKSPKEKE